MAGPAFVDFIHRTIADAEVYFVASRSPQPQAVDCLFRVDRRQPEIWDPVAGQIRGVGCFSQAPGGGHTFLPLQLPANGSLFVIFRKPIAWDRQGTARSNFPAFSKLAEIAGPWTVRFDPKWGGPESISFEKLDDWTKRAEEGVKFYSGKATYVREFDLPTGRWAEGRGQSAAADRPPRPLAGEGPGVRAAGSVTGARPRAEAASLVISRPTDGPKAPPFAQPRATPWGDGSREESLQRPNGPTVRQREPLARWADHSLQLSSDPQGDALGWENRRPFGAANAARTAAYSPGPLPTNLRSMPAAETKRRLFLDLGVVKNIAQVRLNGHDLGVVWTAPWRVDITDAVKPTGNRLEIDVVNVWANRIIHDWTLPPEKRLTRTNVSYPKDQPLLSSGLLGPVTLQAAE